MLFSSIPFLFYFLPAVILIYFIAGKRHRNTALLISSLIFYAWGEPKYVLLMMASIGAAYVFGLQIEGCHKAGRAGLAKALTALSIAVSLAGLVYFKYTDFFIDSFNKAFGTEIPLLKIALPIGISFYTFQIISYTVDVYRENVSAQKNIIKLAAYISLFPQLIAGPIVRYSDIEKQLGSRSITLEKTADGMRRFMIGLSKKILIANQLGELCQTFKVSDDKSLLFFWLYAIAYCLHIYFDFSGYSDMAIGLGKIFGFELLENFNYPFISKSISEFWRRWHISLGSWFRDYVYIPLGGSRAGKAKQLFNIFLVWMLTGFWHGAAWNFIFWGLYFAVLLVIEKFFLEKLLSKAGVFSHIYLIVLIIISFVIFDARDMGSAMHYIGAMFGLGDYPLVSPEFNYYLRSYAVILIIAIIGATPLPKLAYKKLISGMSREKQGDKAAKASGGILPAMATVIEPLLLCGALTLCTAFLVDGSFNPFLYFRF